MRYHVLFMAALLAPAPAFAVLDVTPNFGDLPPGATDVSATVEKAAGDCSSDVGCSLTVRTADSKTAIVVLNEGDSMPTCKINQQAAKDAMTIAAGTAVVIHVNVIFHRNKRAQDYYYLCGDDASITAK